MYQTASEERQDVNPASLKQQLEQKDAVFHPGPQQFESASEP